MRQFDKQRTLRMDNRHFPLLGWCEWVALPELDISRIRCKVDTGAKTSALHAFYVEEFTENGYQKVRFGVHPAQGKTDQEIHCVADIFDRRQVTDSGGHKESRIVIQTPVILGGEKWPIEITLTNRDSMRFRMLLGRGAIADNFTVDPGTTHLMGLPKDKPVDKHVVTRRHDEEE